MMGSASWRQFRPVPNPQMGALALAVDGEPLVVQHLPRELANDAAVWREAFWRTIHVEEAQDDRLQPSLRAAVRIWRSLVYFDRAYSLWNCGG